MLDQELARSSSGRDSMLTIGVFDGVHRGHQHLIGRLIRDAAATRRLAGVVTFRDHPATILRPDFKPRYLTSLDERIRLLRALGVDFVVPITFDVDLSRLHVRDFAARLQRHLRMRGLVVGPDFAMGHNRQGDSKTLAALGGEMGFTVGVVDLLVDGGHAVKSTAIRNALSRGEVAGVAEMLGRSFALSGTVITGHRRGRTLGFPTANLDVPPEMAVPPDGIYATWARVGKACYMAATSIGTRPTFDDRTGRSIEAFLLDFSGDLYGKTLRLEFVQRLRDELKFDTVDALLAQIGRDVELTRAILQGSGVGGQGSGAREA